MNKNILKSATAFLSLFLVLSMSCSTLGNVPGPMVTTRQPAPVSHVRQLQTAPYVGDKAAIIFTVIQPTDNNLQDTVDQIIRLFGEKRSPLDVAVAPAKDGNYDNIVFLRHYVDAGLIDISVNGNPVAWLDTGTSKQDQSYGKLKADLIKARSQLKSFFGDEPMACLIPSEDVDEGNYSLIQDAGFRVLSSSYSADFNISPEPLGWTGKVEPNGMYRLPSIGTSDYSAQTNMKIPASLRPNPDKKLLAELERVIGILGVAVVEIQPSLFTGPDNKPDSARLARLSEMLKSCQQLGRITTFENWCKYMARWSEGYAGKQRVMPPYNGGPAIIFRMDDVSVGWHEEIVEAIIKLFQKNGVPVDLGIVSNVDGTDSYEMPWLRKYLDQGTIGISVHGYDWTYYQFDTTRDLQSRQALLTETCNLPGTAEQPEIPPERLTYAYIKFKLMMARDQYLQYFGVNPIALTVPTDFYDETGYAAIRDAGFKVFATQITTDPHPSIGPVDYFGKRDSTGMYRIPTATDVCVWDNCTWGDVFDISNIRSITDYCKYHSAWDEVFYNDFGAMLCGLLGYLGVAAIGIHPDGFVGIDGKPNEAKLEKLDAIIKYCKTIATITTFEQWYNYSNSHK